MAEAKTILQQEALERATQGQALTNYPAIFAGFTAKGIPESEIKPRDNVFTFHAWKALDAPAFQGSFGKPQIICGLLLCEQPDHHKPLLDVVVTRMLSGVREMV